jgi:hypothetical protein
MISHLRMQGAAALQENSMLPLHMFQPPPRPCRIELLAIWPRED